MRTFFSTSTHRKEKWERKEQGQSQEDVIDNVNSGNSGQQHSTELAAQVAGTVDSEDSPS